MREFFAPIDGRTRVILLVSAALLPLIYGTVWRVLTGPYSTDLQATVVTAVVVGALGSLVGYWLGSSAPSNKPATAPAEPPRAP